MPPTIRLLALLVATLPVDLARAQLPAGDLVVSSFRAAAQGRAGLGGLYFVNPATPTPRAVTGLPPEVTGQNHSSIFSGADMVLRRPSDGALITNGWGPANVQLPLFVLQLTGMAVTSVTRYDLGTVTNINGLGNPASVLLPDERIAVAVDPNNLGVAGETLFGTLLGIVDPRLPPTNPAAVTAVPVSPIPPGFINSFAIDVGRNTAYVGMEVTGPSATIYSIPFPMGGAPVPIVSFSGAARTIVVEASGTLLVGGSGGSNGSLFRVDPSSRAITVFPQFPTGAVQSIRIDPVTGDLFAVHVTPTTTTVQVLSPLSPTGVRTQLTGGPAGGWGVPSGIDMYPFVETYDAASGCAGTYDWVLAPNAGGSPAVGNLSFGLQIAATPAPLASGVLFGLARSSTPVVVGCPLTLLVQPIASIGLASGALMNLALPIPATPGLVGAELFAQTVHADATGFGLSAGVHVTIH